MASFGFYVISQNGGNSSNGLLTPNPIVSSNNANNTSTKKNPKTVVVTKPNIPSTPVAPSSPPVVKKNGIYNDGEYTGSVADAYYGNVQVKAIILGGRLVDIQFLDYPQDRNTSIRINSYALPILKQEAISAQSANVNAVSGASETSPAFTESLTSALNQARA